MFPKFDVDQIPIAQQLTTNILKQIIFTSFEERKKFFRSFIEKNSDSSTFLSDQATILQLEIKITNILEVEFSDDWIEKAPPSQRAAFRNKSTHSIFFELQKKLSFFNESNVLLFPFLLQYYTDVPIPTLDTLILTHLYSANVTRHDFINWIDKQIKAYQNVQIPFGIPKLTDRILFKAFKLKSAVWWFPAVETICELMSCHDYKYMYKMTYQICLEKLPGIIYKYNLQYFHKETQDYQQHYKNLKQLMLFQCTPIQIFVHWNIVDVDVILSLAKEEFPFYAEIFPLTFLVIIQQYTKIEFTEFLKNHYQLNPNDLLQCGTERFVKNIRNALMEQIMRRMEHALNPITEE
jgi:hypothetical protein